MEDEEFKKYTNELEYTLCMASAGEQPAFGVELPPQRLVN